VSNRDHRLRGFALGATGISDQVDDVTVQNNV
jgi:hypothetical protein